jgi:hypothetical protein
MSDLQEQCDNLAMENNDLNHKINCLLAVIDNLKGLLSDVIKQPLITKLREEINRKDLIIGYQKQIIENLESRVDEQNKIVDDCKKSINCHREDIETYRQDIEFYRQKNIRMQKDLEDMQMDIDNIQKDRKERVDDLRTIIEDIQTDRRKKVAELYTIIDNMRSDHRKEVDNMQSDHRKEVDNMQSDHRHIYQLLAKIKTDYLWTVIQANEKLKKKRTKIENQKAAMVKLQKMQCLCNGKRG